MPAVAIIGPNFYGFDPDSNARLAFGKVYAYESGTNIPKDTYTDETATVANTNPVILNGAGYASIYLSGSYKIVLTDADDNEIWTADPVSDPTQLGLEWLYQQEATRLANNRFSLSGDQTANYVVGRAVRLQDASYIFGHIESVALVAGNTEVTILAEENLTASLTTAWVSTINNQNALPFISSSTGSKQTISESLDLRTVYFTSISAMQATADDLIPGQQVTVKGTSFTYDGSEFVLTSNARPESWGALGDGTDDSAAFEAMKPWLPDDSCIELTPGATYLVPEIEYLNRVSVRCKGRATLITNGFNWWKLGGRLDITLLNIDWIPVDPASQATGYRPFTLTLENKNFGESGTAKLIGLRLPVSENRYYAGPRVTHQAFHAADCKFVFEPVFTDPAAKNGDSSVWLARAGDGFTVVAATYCFMERVFPYYSTNGVRFVGQCEEIHLDAVIPFNCRKLWVFEELVNPANEHRIENCHGVAYVSGLEISQDDNSRKVLCSIQNSSVFVAADTEVAQFSYAKVCLDGGTIDNFQCFNSSSRGTNDIGIWLRNGSRNVKVTNPICRGVGTGVYIDTPEQNSISDISMLKSNMVGANPVSYAYGPNAGTTPIGYAMGIRDSFNSLPSPLIAPRLHATDFISLKNPTTVASGAGADKLQIADFAGNFRFNTADAAGNLQFNLGIDQGGGLRTRTIRPIADNAFSVGSADTNRYTTIYITSSPVVTSDKREKTAKRAYTSQEVEVAKTLLKTGCLFKLKASVEEKGKRYARWHAGWMAQEVEQSFVDQGLNAHEYGLFCLDEWDEQEEIWSKSPDETDASGNIITEGQYVLTQEARRAGYRLGLRYDELNAFIWGALGEKLAALLD